MEKLGHMDLGLDIEEIAPKLHIRRSVDWQEVQAVVEAAGSLISAKAVYQVCYIQEKLEDGVVIDGVHLRSRVLRKNLDNAWRAFPYVVTIGSQLEEKIRS